MTFLVRCAGPIVFACTLVSSTPVFGKPTPLDQTLTGEAKVAYEAALSLFNSGDYQGALVKFGRVQELSHEPRILWNMAVCEKNQHRYANAARFIQRYLDDAKDLPAQERADAAGALSALEALFSYVWLVDAPAGANIIVDQTVSHTAPLVEPLWLDLGTHTITVSKDGYETRSQQLEVVGAGQPVLDARLAKIPKDEVQVNPARLKITTEGAEDLVSVDGRVLGSHEWEGELSPGGHTIRVTAAGKVTYERTVHLKAGAARTLHVALDDERTYTWYWLAGGTALAVASMGGYFLFTAEEPTGPTGSLTTVYLP